MGRMKKLYQAKRFLALVLAVAMAVTMVPTTAYAATPGEDALETVTDSNAEPETADGTDGDVAGEESDEPTDDTVTTVVNEETPKESGDDETPDDLDKEAAGESVPATGEVKEDDAVADANAPKSDASVTDDAATADDAQKEVAKEGAEDEAQAQADAVVPAFKMIYENEGWEATYEHGEPRFSYNTTLSLSILAGICVEVGEEKHVLSQDDEVTQTVKYQWFEGDKALGDAKLLSETGTFPTEVGTYKLVLTLPAKEGVYAETKDEFKCEVVKAKVSVDFAVNEAVVPGTAKKAVEEWKNYSVNEVYSDVNGAMFTFTYVQDDPETADVDESQDNDVKFTPVIKDAATGADLGDEDKLTKDNEYVITLIPEFIGADAAAYAKNYEFEPCGEQQLTVGKLKDTKLALTLGAKYNDAAFKTTVNAELLDDGNTGEAVMVQVIEAASVSAVIDSSAKKPDYTAAVSVENGTDATGATVWAPMATADTDIKGAWYSVADFTMPWKEVDKTYCKLTLGSELADVPTLPGIYVYRVSYEGAQTEYAASYADIVVVVEKAEIVVRPKVESNVKFYDRQKIGDVLAKITYDLPYADGRKDGDKEVLYPIAENMWGTSYDSTDETQPYKPDFELVEVIKDKDGKEIRRQTYTAEDDGWKQLDSKNDYYVRFNGKKSVYYSWGGAGYSVDINARVDSMNPDTCVFTVKTGDEVYEKYQVKLEVGEVNQQIDVSGIVAAAGSAGLASESVGALEGVYAKVYDDNRLFVNYAAYQKAKLKGGASSDSDRSFRYNWEKSSYSYDELVAPKKDGGFEIDKETAESSFGYWDESISPQDAGVYRLEVTLKDLDGANFAEPEYVYFVIKPQELTVKFSGTSFVGNVGNTQKEFLENHKKELADGTTVTLMDGMDGKPSKAEDWKNYDGLSEGADYAYKVTWEIKQKQKNADGTDQVGEDGKPVAPEPIGTYNRLTAAPDEYVLSVKEIQAGRADKNNFRKSANYKVKYEIPDLPITVEAMGEAAIKFAGITTTDGKALELSKTYDALSIYELLKDQFAVLNAPITVGEDGKTKVADVTVATGLTYAVYVNGGSAYRAEKVYDGKLPTEAEDWEWAKDEGTYDIKVKFGGNKDYAPLSEVMLASITVEPKELIFTMPALTEKFKVGDSVADVKKAVNKALDNMTGDIVKAAEGEIPEQDKKYFTKDGNALQFSFSVYSDEEGEVGSWVIPDDGAVEDVSALLTQTGNKYYTVDCECSISPDEDNVADNYFISVEPESIPLEVGRGRATVSMQDYSGTKLDITDPESDAATLEHSVTVEDGIPYSNGKPEGNIVTVTITAPADNSIDMGKVIYSQAIKNYAKDRLVGEPVLDEYARTITFKYDATDVTEKEDRPFSIRWAQDYNENFTLLFSKAEKLGNLKEAVAPKSLAFNAPLTTMVVGQEQELDVKITKEQSADIICLGYRVIDGNEYLHVNEYGKVTALKADKTSKATVEVYPMHLVNGKKEPIPDAKTATVKIAVKDVSAPKISKLIPQDNSVTVQYALPKENDGYRREIYVVQGKNVKPDEIKKMVNSMENGQWKGTFATAPVFVNYNEEYDYRVYDGKKNTYLDVVEYQGIGGDLIPGEDYTVYIRNVSAMRSVEDGVNVSFSEAGTAKGFTATKIQVDKISTTLKDRDIYMIDDEVLDAPTQEDIRDADSIAYEVPLTDNSVDISLEGLFYDASGDPHYEALPFNNADAKANYAAPKIAYCFYEYVYDGYNIFGEPIKEQYDYVTASSLASISNKGKVTLKQPGTLHIYAYDADQTAASKSLESIQLQELIINVTAEADSMKPKNTTLSIGQSIRLERLLDYKQGNKVLDQKYFDSYNRIDVAKAKAKLGNNEQFGISDDGYLTAYAKGDVTLELEDKKLGSVSVKVKCKELAPVKGLTAVNVIDNRFDVQFEANMYAEAYRIEVLDAKKLIRSIYVENLPFSNDERVFETNDWYESEEYKDWRPAVGDDDDWGTDYDEWYDGYTHDNQHWVKGNYLAQCHMENGKWLFRYRIKDLTQTSKYNIKVTALCGKESSKTMAKAVTTTKLPAYDYWTTSKIEKGMTYSYGMPILASKNINNNQMIGNYPFVSGNTYNLVASGYNQGARIAGTDTLTWTSSDKKVATVQATSGGYSATLKATKEGVTVIEVKSSVLKNVIARRTIRVYAVGDAYNGRDYWGENQELRGGDDGKEEVITGLSIGVPAAVDLGSGQSRKFSFTTREEGYYQIYKVTKDGHEVSVSGARYCNGNSELTISASVDGPFAGSVVVKRTGSNKETTGFANRQEIKVGKTIASVGSDTWYTFTAPEEGLYGIKVRKSGVASVQSGYFRVYRQDTTAEGGWKPNSDTPEPQALFYQFKAGEMVYLQATGYANDVTVAKADFTALNVGDSVPVSGKSEKWFEFTPAKTSGAYRFAGLSSYNGIKVYDEEFRSISHSNYGDYWNPDKGNDDYFFSYSLEKDKKVYVQVVNNSSAINMSVKDRYQEFGEDGTYTVNDDFLSYNDYLYITYTVKENGTYVFSSEAVSNADWEIGYGELYVNDSYYETMYIGSDASATGEYELTAGDSVSIRISSYSCPLTWENVKIKAEKVTAAPAQ